MILIGDSSALITLSICNALEYLDILFDQVIVPQAVFNEVSMEDKPESISLSRYLSNKVQSVNIEDFVITDFSVLNGELEAMALYKRLGADRLLIDDKRARRLAQLNGINTIGSMGILLIAKEKGLIKRVKPFLQKIKQSDIFINKELFQYVLELAGEA